MEENKKDQEDSIIDRVRQNLYYVIIAVLSIVVLVFLPMLSSSVGLGWNIPNTTAGWIVWILMKVIVATLNVLIFHSFMEQGKLNINDHPDYIKAREILQGVHVKSAEPRSPKKYKGQQYGKKGVTIFFSTALATAALTQALLAYNWVEMLTYLFTIIMGIVFGVMQMKSAEEYWTEEYLNYALMKQKQWEQEEKAQKGSESVQNGPQRHGSETVGHLSFESAAAVRDEMWPPLSPAWTTENKEEKK